MLVATPWVFGRKKTYQVEFYVRKVSVGLRQTNSFGQNQAEQWWLVRLQGIVAIAEARGPSGLMGQ